MHYRKNLTWLGKMSFKLRFVFFVVSKWHNSISVRLRRHFSRVSFQICFSFLLPFSFSSSPLFSFSGNFFPIYLLFLFWLPHPYTDPNISIFNFKLFPCSPLFLPFSGIMKHDKWKKKQKRKSQSILKHLFSPQQFLSLKINVGGERKSVVFSLSSDFSNIALRDLNLVDFNPLRA